MLKLMLNTAKILIKKKSFILMSIIAPTVTILFFTFAFDTEPTYRVGIIDNDISYISNEIVDSIKNIQGIDVVNIKEENSEVLLITQQIQMVIEIKENFGNDMLNLKHNKINIKTITKSDMKEVLKLVIQSKTQELTMLARMCNEDINKFKELNENDKNILDNYKLNETENKSQTIKYSIGMVIMIIFVTGANIATFLIEDEENNTKQRILLSGIKSWQYNFSMLFVFYILSSISTIIYYFLCSIFNINFNMENTFNFIVIMLLLNLVSVCLNLFIVSMTKSRYVASTLNILIVVPSCMLSGLFWDFSIMPKYLQTIGSYLPQRWAYVCIEELQRNKSLLDISNYIISMAVVSIILYCMSIMLHNKKYN